MVTTSPGLTVSKVAVTVPARAGAASASSARARAAQAAPRGRRDREEQRIGSPQFCSGGDTAPAQPPGGAGGRGRAPLRGEAGGELRTAWHRPAPAPPRKKPG